MNNSNLEKPVKSTAWIVATIWANIIIIGLITFIVLLLLNFLFVLLFDFSIFDILIGRILLALVIIGQWIYAIRLGVKTVVKKSVINKKKIFKVCLWVALIHLFLMTGLILLWLVLLTVSPPLEIMLLGGWSEVIKMSLIMWGFSFLISLGCFGVTYYWCKKLIR